MNKLNKVVFIQVLLLVMYITIYLRFEADHRLINFIISSTFVTFILGIVGFVFFGVSIYKKKTNYWVLLFSIATILMVCFVVFSIVARLH